MNKLNKVLVSIFTALVIFCGISPVFAQEASPSGSLLQKLNELKTEIASKAAEIKTEVNKKVQDKAVIGSIIKIETSDIVVQTLNSTKTIKFDEFTEILGSKNKKIKIDTLEEGDNIASLGDIDDKNNLVAKRILYLDKASSPSADLVWGQIQKSTSPTITLKDKLGEIHNINTNSLTEFYLGNNEASFEDAKAEKFMVARGTKAPDGSIKAKFVYFIPSVGFVKPGKSASPSASVKASSKN